MRDLNYQLKKLCRQNRDGSYGTQEGRWRMLDLMATQLDALGYKHLQATSLKAKHVATLIEHWQAQGISTGTLKNRLSVLRWWAGKVNKPGVVARDNSFYGIGARTLVAKESRAQRLDEAMLAKVNDTYVRLSLKLQASFGLRREEAIKFSPSYAFRGDHIALKASWTKGGRARTVPITSPYQYVLMQEVRDLVGGGSLIPPKLNYAQQKHRYDRQVRKAGIRNPHGLRHAYAQRRYEELTGWKASLAGGPRRTTLSYDERILDEKARATISAELGHNRTAITRTYLGK